MEQSHHKTLSLAKAIQVLRLKAMKNFFIPQRLNNLCYMGLQLLIELSTDLGEFTHNSTLFRDSFVIYLIFEGNFIMVWQLLLWWWSRFSRESRMPTAIYMYTSLKTVFALKWIKGCWETLPRNWHGSNAWTDADSLKPVKSKLNFASDKWNTWVFLIGMRERDQAHSNCSLATPVYL